jgi:hypothetical protein
MKDFISQRTATYGLLLLLSLFVLFHLLILTEVIPFNLVWGGRLKNASEMVKFETVSIVMNLLMLAIVGIRAGFLKVKINYSITRLVFLAMGFLFLLNTAGNVLSHNALEKMLFTPVTFLLSIFSFRLAFSKPQVKIAVDQ